MSMIGSKSPFGHRLVGSDGTPIPYSVASLTALKAIEAADRVAGQVVLVDDGSEWVFNSSSSLTGDDIVIATPAAGTGRWLRKVGFVDLGLPIAFGLADGATIWTVPTGCIFKLESAHWHVTTAWAGGSSSAIGIAATGHATAGDILGGAGGDVEATLTVGRKAGTVGAKMDTDAELHSMIFVATNAFTYEEITSAFTSGAGYVRLVGALLANAGA